jgi:hypothetical protein
MTRKNYSLRILILVGLALCLIGPAMAVPVAAQASDEFTIVVLPDTQYYSDDDPEVIFRAQTQWIVDNQTALNIVYVAHEGDIVNLANQTSQWQNADAAMDLLDLAEIPYGVLPGNHDQDPNGNPDGTTNYNAYFGTARFSGKPYYGGHHGDDNDNNYALFTAGGMDFIVINLEYNLHSAAITWADSLLTTYSDRRAIVVSHSILGYPPSGSPIAPFTSIGQDIYDALKDNENLFLMLCGHNHAEGWRADTYNDHLIYTILADYQDLTAGGNGWLRIMTFSPDSDEISITTYSPTLDAYGAETTMGTDTTLAPFTLAYDMGDPDPIIAIGGTPLLDAFSSQPGTPSEEQTYTVMGSSLTEDIVITTPDDFEISTTSGSGFGQSLTLSPSGGTVAETTIYIRFDRDTDGSSSGAITHTSSGAVPRTMAVDGVAASTVTFQQGVDSYSGTVDTYIREYQPSTAYDDDLSFEWDGSDPGTNENFSLIRFDDIIGTSPGQIPPDTTIHSATLTYYVHNTGNPADVNEISIEWSEDVTYNGFGGDAGVQPDEYGDPMGSASGGDIGIRSIDVTDSLTAWAGDPSSNHGWIFRPTGSNGVEVHSSEYGTVDQRPRLTVEYSNPTAVTLASFTATWDKAEVIATWETAAEINTVGFNLWRSETHDGGYTQVNNALIPAASLGGVWGSSYTYTDSGVTPGTTYYYKLHELEVGGASNWYGPVSTAASEDNPASVILFQATTERSGSRAFVLRAGTAALAASAKPVVLTRQPKQRRQSLD